MAERANKRFYSRRHLTLTQRLAHYTDKSGGPDACWTWTGSRTKWGYGQLHWRGSPRLINRLAWAETNGPIPPGLHVLHRCDNPPCCNPAHLWTGTNADNMADKMRKGRNRTGRAKLTEDDVRAIRAAVGTRADIAKRFGVTQATVSRILRGVSWKHVT